MMDLFEYWPTREHINQCIRTEAEELVEHTLLAVHEPMRLRRKGLSETEICSDQDLLKEFLQIERPIPIIGRSGVGKSHLIRWLHAQLRVHPEATDWHIVRIPKNASLRQVMELLLTGLEGEEFEQVRRRVKSVGVQLKKKTRDVAENLLITMGQQLRELFNHASTTVEQHRQRKSRPQPDEEQQLRIILRHCGELGLTALINDSHYKTNLLKKEHCIYQFAKRLTSGANDEELFENIYQVQASDLDFNYNLNDLAIPARQYVQQAQLNTSESKRQEAALVLNTVLGDAIRNVFEQFFQFGGGNFQELFKHIRRDLFLKNQTLVVLVEDMAAISAIEDVLIDSLLEEGLYDGVETMCSLRSAIAVTDGYSGYQRRQDTVRTRATAEWWIDEERQEGETELVLQQRVVDFCSRYINAARHGKEALEQHWDKKEENRWPPVWENEEIDRQYLDAFGRAGIDISLYPFSPLAIKALVNKHCRDDQRQLRFNPRQVINQILLAILRDCRIDAEHGKFPPPMLAGIHAPGGLRGELAPLGLTEQVRCESLAAIWGYGAENLAQLKEKLSADIALSFGLTDLVAHLQGGMIDEAPKTEPKRDNKKKKFEAQTPPKQTPPPNPGEQKLLALLTEVDLWCQREKDLAQIEAKILRKALADMYHTYARKEWVGIAELPSIKSYNRVNITLPFAAGNIIGWVVEFCSESDFKDPIKSILIHGTARAMIRYSHFNPETRDGKGWNYPEGHEDFLHYQNFAARWVLGVLRTLREKEREKLDDFMSAHVAAARTLAVFKDSDNHRERLNKLLQSQQTLAEVFPPPVCNTVSNERQPQLDQWEPLQGKWLKLLSSNDHGLEGDLALVALKDALKAPFPNRINQAVTRSLLELEQEYVNVSVSLFADCDNVDDFTEALKRLQALIKQLRTSGKYPTGDQVVTSAVLLKKINMLIETGHFEQVKKMKLCENGEVGQIWQILNELDGNKLRLISAVMDNWQKVYDKSLHNLLTENSVWGGGRILEAREIIDSLLTSLCETVTSVQQGGRDDNA